MTKKTCKMDGAGIQQKDLYPEKEQWYIDSYSHLIVVWYDDMIKDYVFFTAKTIFNWDEKKIWPLN